MEKKQSEYFQLKFGLALKKKLDENKAKALDNKQQNIKDHRLIDSFGKLESSAGLRKATLIDFVTGKTNTKVGTFGAILEALQMSLSDFSIYYDRINDKEILEYKRLLEKSRKERVKKITKQKSKK